MAHGLRGTPPSDRLLWTATFSSDLLDYAGTTETLGFAALSVNDHLLFSRPWLDGPTTLFSVLAATGRMDLMTTLALPVVRGPVALAKSMAAIDILSGDRLLVGVGPGSSARDYDAVSVPLRRTLEAPR
jgi:alkanesulfonate monooxygenase SsuD/methylene tetrahydromethanopterin reductase-like flavin-dependent oxidoreductase (luciferase family)